MLCSTGVLTNGTSFSKCSINLGCDIFLHRCCIPYPRGIIIISSWCGRRTGIGVGVVATWQYMAVTFRAPSKTGVNWSWLTSPKASMHCYCWSDTLRVCGGRSAQNSSHFDKQFLDRTPALNARLLAHNQRKCPGCERPQTTSC